MSPIAIPGQLGHTGSPPRVGLVIGPSEIAQLPTSGATWLGGTPTRGVAHYASQDIGGPTLCSNNDEDKDVYTFARALAWRRDPVTFPGYREDVLNALLHVVNTGHLFGTNTQNPNLALARNLLPYILAADVIDLRNWLPTEFTRFANWLQFIRTFKPNGRRSLIETHMRRPNNFGTHAGASRIALDLLIGDQNDLGQAVSVFYGWLGDITSYTYPDIGDWDDDSFTWMSDEENPVGINAAGGTKVSNDGTVRNVDGVLPEEQRRADPGSNPAGAPDIFSFTWPPLRDADPQGGFDSQYVYDALQGVVVSALLLWRAGGYSPWTFQNEAIGRAFAWLNDAARGNLLVNDATHLPTQESRWVVDIINRVYGTSYARDGGGADTGTKPGKGFGYADWFCQYIAWP